MKMLFKKKWETYPVANGVGGIGVGSFFSVDSKREGGGAIAAPAFGTNIKLHKTILKHVEFS